MADKKTKRDYFTDILAVVKENKELTDFVNKELDLLDKKNKSKSKAQVLADELTMALAENIELMFMDKPLEIFTATQVGQLFGHTVQKVTPILTDLTTRTVIARTEVKGKANFQLCAKVEPVATE